jgi:amino acid adenylation domain-containing protein
LLPPAISSPGADLPEPDVDPDDSVPARVEAVVAAEPERDAVRSNGQTWTYAELNRAANQLAHALLGATEHAASPVALLLEHHAPAIAAILGVLKTGRSYVCLDPSFPRHRNASILADSGARQIVCDLPNLARAATLASDGHALLLLEDLPGGLPSDNPGVPVRAGMDLGIFYTSGSTGAPKGVLWRHDICLHRMQVDRLVTPIDSGDRLTLLTPLAFPAATSNIFWALLSGACLCLYDVRKLGTAGFADWLRDQEISCLRSPVALFRHFLESIPAGLNLPRLRLVVLSGDALFAHDVERARERLPECAVIVNRYSTSEAGLVCVNRITRETEVDPGIVPLGRPVPGKRVRLLDADGSPLAADSTEPGEIAIASAYLAAGYRGLPELTNARFLPDPENPGGRLYRSGDLGRLRADGSLEFLGRRDHRLKIRGYPVELAAVEAALNGIAGVEVAAVTTRPDASGENSLVAHVAPQPGRKMAAAQLRRSLAQILPEYMIPASVLVRAELPLTPSGKIDRQALSSSDTGTPAPRPTASLPRSDTEARIARIWREVLGLEQVGRDEDFFSLGGHSLLAARVIARLNDDLRLDLPLASFYLAPTVSGLAALIAHREAPPEDGERESDLGAALLMLGIC